MKTLQKAIQFFLADLGLHNHHVILMEGNDVIEWKNTTQPGAEHTEIVVSLEETNETNHGECYQTSPYLVKINPELSQLQQLIVVAHELKHVQEYVKNGETMEDTAHNYDWRGAWVGLQWKLLTLQQYKQLVALEK